MLSCLSSFSNKQSATCKTQCNINWQVDKFDLAVNWLLIAKGSILINYRMRLLTYLLVINTSYSWSNKYIVPHWKSLVTSVTCSFIKKQCDIKAQNPSWLRDNTNSVLTQTDRKLWIIKLLFWSLAKNKLPILFPCFTEVSHYLQ